MVLPEVAVTVGPSTRALWFDALRRWAVDTQAVVVAGFYDELSRQNQLVVLDARGRTHAEYEKQHPGPHEPRRHHRSPPLVCRGLDPRLPTVSAVICADLDYDDLLGPVAGAGGVLVVPANDWPRLEELHYQTAVWAAVRAGVPIVRATGHGISAIYDSSGRVLARGSSLEGPVTLIADVPFAEPQAADWALPPAVIKLVPTSNGRVLRSSA